MSVDRERDGVLQELCSVRCDHECSACDRRHHLALVVNRGYRHLADEVDRRKVEIKQHQLEYLELASKARNAHLKEMKTKWKPLLEAAMDFTALAGELDHFQEFETLSKAIEACGYE